MPLFHAIKTTFVTSEVALILPTHFSKAFVSSEHCAHKHVWAPFCALPLIRDLFEMENLLEPFSTELKNGGKVPVWHLKERCLSFTDKTLK